MSDPGDVAGALPERALGALVARARHGALATLAREPQGWPFASLVALAFDRRARPLFLLSRLAEHTKNLEVCTRASLLVAERERARERGHDREHGGEDVDRDPLAAPRVTLVGSCARVSVAEEPEGRATFVAAHPEASAYAAFSDFGVWRLEIESARWVGGFGRIAWLPRDAYERACSGGG
jgi:putative heme iron utilization protein